MLDFYFAPYVAAIAVALFVVVVYGLGHGSVLGPSHTYWNDIRATALPALDEKANELGFFTTNRAHDSEYVATVEADLEEIELWMYDNGYDRNVVSGLKYRTDENGDREYEATSWADRESQHPLIPDELAFWQTHVYVFENEDGSHDLYAHYEYSSHNPIVAYKHLRGVDQDHERGVEVVKELLAEDPSLLVIEIDR